MNWEELSTKDFDRCVEEGEYTCILPIGVLEKHGDHLPLGTDMYIVTEVAKAAAAISPAVVFPYYFLGQIAEAKHVKGTIAASHRLIMDALLEICDEIHRNGFKKIYILNGHGGNTHFLPFFAQQFPGLNRNYAVYTSFAHDMSDEQLDNIREKTGFLDLGEHAGITETALLMHLRPDLVDMNAVKIEESQSLGRLDAVEEHNIFTPFFWYAKFPHHFAGDPTGSTEQLGEFIFNIMRDNTVKRLNEIKKDKVSLELIEGYNCV